MNSLVAAVDTDLSDTFPQTKPGPLAIQVNAHREAIARHEQEIAAAECDHDIRRRSLEADIEQLDRRYEAERKRLVRAIEEEDHRADHLINARQRIVRAFRSALAILEPNEAERAAPMEGRLVPRSQAPVQRHKGMRS
jgi:hypothetical protein